MNSAIVFLIVFWFFVTIESLYHDQRKVYKFDDYATGLSQIDSNEDHYTLETYYEAIKETFDLYHRDEKYKNGESKFFCVCLPRKNLSIHVVYSIFLTLPRYKGKVRVITNLVNPGKPK